MGLDTPAVGVNLPVIDTLFSVSVRKWAKMQLGWDLDVDVVRACSVCMCVSVRGLVGFVAFVSICGRIKGRDGEVDVSPTPFEVSVVSCLS